MSMQARYFSVVVKNIQGFQDWCVTDAEAYRVGVPQPKETKNAYLSLKSSTDFQAQFQLAFPMWQDVEFHEKMLAPGEYYARMARPTAVLPQAVAGFPTDSLYTADIADAAGQLTSLVARMREICQVVQPDPRNMGTFGHATRELLILACTEVETHWKAVLRANGFTRSKMTTADYVKTLAAMKLSDYEIEFRPFPRLSAFRPFAGWDTSAPTSSLPFYDAYNAVKHDRQKEFQRASLELAMAAVAACLILTVAQFGQTSIIRDNRGLDEFFRVKMVPQWDYRDLYTSESPHLGWKAKELRYPF